MCVASSLDVSAVAYFCYAFRGDAHTLLSLNISSLSTRWKDLAWVSTCAMLPRAFYTCPTYLRRRQEGMKIALAWDLLLDQPGLEDALLVDFASLVA